MCQTEWKELLWIEKTTYYDAIDKWQSILSLCLSALHTGTHRHAAHASVSRNVCVCFLLSFRWDPFWFVAFNIFNQVKSGSEITHEISMHTENPKIYIYLQAYMHTTITPSTTKNGLLSNKKKMLKIWFVSFWVRKRLVVYFNLRITMETYK